MENDSDEYVNELLAKNSQSKKKSKKRYLFEKIKNTIYDNVVILEDGKSDNNTEMIKTGDTNDNIIKENLDKNNHKFKIKPKIHRKKIHHNNKIILSYEGIQNLRSALVDFNMNISVNIITSQGINEFFIFMRDFLMSEIDEELYLEMKRIMWKCINKILSNKICNNIITNMKCTFRDVLLRVIEKNINS